MADQFPALDTFIDYEDYIVLALADSGAEVDAQQLETALAHTLERLCPWPAVRVKDAFWFTSDGSLVANCQWKLYGHEAITQSEAAQLLNVSKSRIWRMAKAGKLTLYRLPDEKLRDRPLNPRSGFPDKPWYVRRSQVERIKG